MWNSKIKFQIKLFDSQKFQFKFQFKFKLNSQYLNIIAKIPGVAKYSELI